MCVSVSVYVLMCLIKCVRDVLFMNLYLFLLTIASKIVYIIMNNVYNTTVHVVTVDPMYLMLCAAIYFETLNNQTNSSLS